MCRMISLTTSGANDGGDNRIGQKEKKIGAGERAAGGRDHCQPIARQRLTPMVAPPPLGPIVVTFTRRAGGTLVGRGRMEQQQRLADVARW